MDLAELQVRPEAEDGARLRRAQLAGATLGMSPALLMLAYADWLAQPVSSRLAGEQVAPPAMGAPGKGHAPLAAAPGTYVLAR